MTGAEVRREILRALRYEPVSLFPLAADIHEPPFRVRAELKTLKRDRLVTDRIGPEGHRWELTARGAAAVNATDQTQFEGIR